RHAVLDQLETPGERTTSQLVRTEPTLEWQQTAREPFAARDVFRQPAEHPHRRVRVRVHEAGEQHAPPQIADLAGRLGRPPPDGGVGGGPTATMSVPRIVTAPGVWIVPLASSVRT